MTGAPAIFESGPERRWSVTRGPDQSDVGASNMAKGKGNLTGGAARGRTPAGTPTIKERWLAARALGEQTFDPGVACVNGHDSPRWSNNGICMACKRIRDNAYNAAHPLEHRARARRSALSRVAEVKAYQRQWAIDNPGRIRAIQQNRNALRIGAQVGCRKAYAAFVAWAKSIPAVRCYWCGAKTLPGDRHLDHIIPLSKGGADAVANLCVSCPRCNLTKNAKLPEEFAGQSELRLA